MKTLLTALAIVFATSNFASASLAPEFPAKVAKAEKEKLYQDTRRKKRIPGGSGCDDAHDRAEHPECRG